MSNLTSFSPSSPIPYGCQTVEDDDIRAVESVLRSSFLTQGPAIEQFEKAVADYCGVAYAVAFSNGTAALHGAYFAAGLGPGDEAITSPITFVATSNALLYQQATPVFADIDPKTWNLSVDAVRAKITPQTKAVIPVHFAGEPVDLDAYYALADEYDLTVIEDACHALGAWYKGKPIGRCRDMAVFSFHPVKSITTGEGGMVVTPHRHLYEKLVRFRSHGITKNTATFQQFDDAPWLYEMQMLGYNYRMTDIQAALGVVQMQKLDRFMAQRARIAQRYRDAFGDLQEIVMQELQTDCRSAHHLCVIRLRPDAAAMDRRTLFDALLTRQVRPQVHYIPVHLQPYYQQQLGTKPGDYPQAEAYYEHCLSLPIYPTLSEEAQEYVIQQVRELVTKGIQT